MKKICQMSLMCFLTGCLLFISFFFYCLKNIPNELNVRYGEKIDSKIFGVSYKSTDAAIPVGKTFFNFANSKNFKAFLFNLLPIKKIQIKRFKNIRVYPGGYAFGVKLLTSGVMIVDMQNVETEHGDKLIGIKAGLKRGDIITKVNGVKIHNNKQFKKIVSECEGNTLNLEIKRDDRKIEKEIKPEFSKKFNKWQIGCWVRDSSAGIGTITFNTKEGIFGGLGHPLCDADTGKIFPVCVGDITRASIQKVKRGNSGDPGELCGYFTGDDSIGQIVSNVGCGLYGKFKKPITEHEEVEIGLKQDIKKGPAKIYCTVQGEKPEEFAVNIESVNFNDENKNMVIKIVDSELISKTGGIVQGMSGSPIIQNGKLIGAITHVFVNDSTKGYGVFAETMIEESSNI